MNSHRAHRGHRGHNPFSVFSVCSVANGLHTDENRYEEATMRRFVTVMAMLAATAIAAQTPTKEQEKPFIQDYIKAVIGAPPASLGVDPFYKKYADALGVSILSSEKVPDAALLVARDIVIHMLAKRPDLRAERSEEHTSELQS